jgi:undecaprenyl diphosphate synthase
MDEPRRPPERDVDQLDRTRLPRHLAIIMDGNGRWAVARAMSRIRGHQQGLEAAKEVIRAAREIGIPVLTLFAFSSENWRRPEGEVRALMDLIRVHLREELRELLEHGIRLTAIGRVQDLPPDVRDILDEAVLRTRQNEGMVLNVALSYGGRAEIVRAVRRLVSDLAAGGRSVEPAAITEEMLSAYLDTAGLPDPDLLIRTSGEFRLSNFLLWQLAYTELYVTPTLWPDFRRAHLIEALLDFQRRERRFGQTSQQLESDFAASSR